MTRSFFAVLVVGVAGLAMVPAYLQGCSQTGVGDPCTPEQEYDPSFVGFAAGEVNVESKSFDCQTRLCLANHFQGRVTCPYGQDKNGKALALNGSSPFLDKNGAPIGGCVLPGGGQDQSDGTPPAGQAVYGTLQNTPPGVTPSAAVSPQCLDRTGGTGGTAVYCSCRCQNVNGKTDDGAVYCACPDGFGCKQLVSPIGTGNEGLTGAYCVKNGSDYDATKSPCNGGAAVPSCDPAKANCGTFNGQ